MRRRVLRISTFCSQELLQKYDTAISATFHLDGFLTTYWWRNYSCRDHFCNGHHIHRRRTYGSRRLLQSGNASDLDRPLDSKAPSSSKCHSECRTDENRQLYCSHRIRQKCRCIDCAQWRYVDLSEMAAVCSHSVIAHSKSSFGN